MADDEGLGYEPSENRHRAAADVQPHLHLHVYDQRQPWPQRELTTPVQENQDFFGQATACLQSLPQTDGDQTIHLGVPVQFPSGNRSTDPLQGISQTRPCGRVQDHQDDLPLMSNEGINIHYPPGAGSRSPQDSRSYRGMEVESAGEGSQDRSFNPTEIQMVPGEQTLLLNEGERRRQLSDSDVSMESEEDTSELSLQHSPESRGAQPIPEEERVKSFGDAPDTCIFRKYSQLNPEPMAKCGFYYIGWKGFEGIKGEEDLVVCIACKTGICKWEPSDDPLIEHVKHGPRDICPYLKSTTKDPGELDNLKEQLRQVNNGEMSRDIDENADKQHMSRDQMHLQQQQVLESIHNMSAASGNNAVLQPSCDMNNSSKYVTIPSRPFSDPHLPSGNYDQNSQTKYKSVVQTRDHTLATAKDKQTEKKTGERQTHYNADGVFLCQNCGRNKVNHTQRYCGHGICGECISRMMGTPMNGRRCVTCNGHVVGYSPWAPNFF